MVQVADYMACIARCTSHICRVQTGMRTIHEIVETVGVIYKLVNGCEWGTLT